MRIHQAHCRHLMYNTVQQKSYKPGFVRSFLDPILAWGMVWLYNSVQLNTDTICYTPSDALMMAESRVKAQVDKANQKYLEGGMAVPENRAMRTASSFLHFLSIPSTEFTLMPGATLACHLSIFTQIGTSTTATAEFMAKLYQCLFRLWRWPRPS